MLKTPEPAADQRVGNLGHLLEELVGGAWRDRSHGHERDHPALCRAARQRHRPLHPGQPRARREDGLEAKSELVGQADRKCRRGGVHPDPATPRPASPRCFRARSTGWIRCRSTIRRGSTPIRAREVLAGPEIRTIFLGMDQTRDELGHSNVKGKNPFKDVRVRKAFYQAIDEEAINKKVMRGQATPTALMIAPSLCSRYRRISIGSPSIPRLRRSCSPRPAIPTVSKCRWTARTIATSTTSRSVRRSSACWRGSGSRST